MSDPELEDRRAHHALAQHLERLREARGLSREELAGRAGLSPDTVRRLEIGGPSPTYRTLRKLALGLDVPVEVVFGVREAGERDPAVEELGRLLDGSPGFPARALLELVRGVLGAQQT